MPRAAVIAVVLLALSAAALPAGAGPIRPLPLRLRIEGYVIVSADGMLADSTGVMPDKLKIDADQRFFLDALDRAALLVHGRKSQEQQDQLRCDFPEVGDHRKGKK